MAKFIIVCLCRAAHFFLSQGHKRGDVLALFMENRKVELQTIISIGN